MTGLMDIDRSLDFVRERNWPVPRTLAESACIALAAEVEHLRRQNRECRELLAVRVDAARLDEANSQNARLRRALEKARDHIDMGRLSISHCKDAELIDAALKEPPAGC